MTIKTTHARKPNLLVLVTFFVVVGFLATGVIQADNTAQADNSDWGLILSEKLANWQPMISIDDGGKGLRLARLFGKVGPTLRIAPSMPYAVTHSLKGSGGSQGIDSKRGMEACLFLQKRW